MPIEAFTTLSNGFEISGVIHLPERYPAPCIICSHGLFSSKDSSKFVAVTEHLATTGFVSLRYDHRGCGASQGRIEQTTVSGRIQDLEAVYRYVRRQPYINGTFGLMGSSMGGYISLLAAANHSVFRALVVWATPFKIGRQSPNHQTADMPLLNDVFYSDLNQYLLGDVLGEVNCCLVLHGEEDELVPAEHAHRIYLRLKEPKTLEIVPGADHRFSNEHHRRQAIERTASFFRTHLPC